MPCRFCTGLKGQPHLQVQLVGPDVNVTAAAVPGSHASCVVSATAPAAGLWQLHVSLGADALSGSPYPLHVLPAVLDPGASYAVSEAGLKLGPCSDWASCSTRLQV